MHITQEGGELGVRYNSRRHNHKIIKGIVYTALMIGLLSALGKVFVRAIDIHIENQDIMLCKSAKISGNIEYLEKCECFYKTENIICLQK